MKGNEMKKLLTFAAALLSFGLVAAEPEMEIIEIRNDNSFNTVVNIWCANTGLMARKPGGKVMKAPGGRSGSCMRITNTATSHSSVFSRALIPVDRTADTIKCSIWVKGKGSFRFGFYLYKAKGRGYVGISQVPVVSVDSKEYKKYDFVFPCSKFNAATKAVRLAIEVVKEADLCFDDFSGVKESLVK